MENWDYYLCEIEESMASILVDLDAGSQADSGRFPRLGYVSVDVALTGDQGLPTQESFQVLAAMEDSLVEALTGDGGTVYVGRCLIKGRMECVFYTGSFQECGAWGAAVSAALCQPDYYPWATGMREEPDWQTYYEFLFPDPLSLLDIRNRRGLARLDEMGDNPEEPRDIEHWLEFPGRDAAMAFAGEFAEKGFLQALESGPWLPTEPDEVRGRMDGGEPDAGPDERWRVRLSRRDAPGDLGELTLELAVSATAYHGDYLGWSCQALTLADDNPEEI